MSAHQELSAGPRASASDPPPRTDPPDAATAPPASTLRASLGGGGRSSAVRPSFAVTGRLDRLGASSPACEGRLASQAARTAAAAWARPAHEGERNTRRPMRAARSSRSSTTTAPSLMVRLAWWPAVARASTPPMSSARRSATCAGAGQVDSPTTDSAGSARRRLPKGVITSRRLLGLSSLAGDSPQCHVAPAWTGRMLRQDSHEVSSSSVSAAGGHHIQPGGCSHPPA